MTDIDGKFEGNALHRVRKPADCDDQCWYTPGTDSDEHDDDCPYLTGRTRESTALLRRCSRDPAWAWMEIERLRADAERYRWLRDPENQWDVESALPMLPPDRLDAWIDESRATGPTPESP